MDYNTFIYLLERQENGNTQGNNEQRYLNAFYKDKGTAYAEASTALLVESKNKIDAYIAPVAKTDTLLNERMDKLGIILPKGMSDAGKSFVDEVKTCGGNCAKKLEAEGSALPSDLEFISGIKEQELKDTKKEVEKKLKTPKEPPWFYLSLAISPEDIGLR